MRFSFYSLLFLILIAASPADELSSARTYFQNSKDSKATAEKLQSITQGKTQAILKAYHGASFAILAKHQSNPLKKLDFLKKGLGIINQSVLLDAADVEIRYIRFAIEENIPSFVSFTSHIDADKKMLINGLSASHSNYNTIKSYLLKSSHLSNEEKKKIK